jgi:hypothetical protein
MATSRTHNQVSDVAASLLNVWSCASSLGLRERGGRTLLQKGESKDKLPTTFVMNVCPSHSRFQPISADIERSRKLSKEARFRAFKVAAQVRIPLGTRDKSSLTRSDTTTASESAFPWIHRQGPREGRTNSRVCCLRQSFRSADFAWSKTERGGIVRSGGWTSSGPQKSLERYSYDSESASTSSGITSGP